MGSGASINVNDSEGMEGNTINMDEKKKLLLKGTTKFFELDINREGYLSTEKIQILIDDILLDYNHQFISKVEIRNRILHKIQMSGTDRMNMLEFFSLFEECSNYINILTLARRKFKSFDKDSNGKIEGKELDELTTWVIESYQPDTYVSSDYINSPEIRNKMKLQILKRVDVNNDGAIDIYDFSLLFEEVTFKIDITYRAKKKFSEYDVNHMDSLDMQKLLKVTDYVIDKLGGAEDKELAKRLVSGKLALNTSDHMCFQMYNSILENVINHIVVMRAAREKFMELDVDHNGFLEGYEIDLLLNWMLAYFCPYGEPLPLEEKQLIKDEMMRKTDENQDGRLNIVEFSVLFEEMTLMLTLPEPEEDSLMDDANEFMTSLPSQPPAEAMSITHNQNEKDTNHGMISADTPGLTKSITSRPATASMSSPAKSIKAEHHEKT